MPMGGIETWSVLEEVTELLALRIQLRVESVGRATREELRLAYNEMPSNHNDQIGRVLLGGFGLSQRLLSVLEVAGNVELRNHLEIILPQHRWGGPVGLQPPSFPDSPCRKSEECLQALLVFIDPMKEDGRQEGGGEVSLSADHIIKPIYSDPS